MNLNLPRPGRDATFAVRRGVEVWPILLAAALCALWPLTAWAVNPLVFPALIAVAAVTVMVMRRPEFGIGLALALAPFTNAVISLGPGSSLAIPSKPLHLFVPAIALGVLIYGALLARGESRSARGGWLTAAVLIFLGSAIISSVGAENPSASLTKIFALVAAMALFFGVLDICRGRAHLMAVVGGVLAGLFLASAQGLLEHYSGAFGAFSSAGSGEVLGRVQGSFGHPNTYGGFVAVLMPLAMAILASSAFSRRARWLAGVTLGLAFPALIFSYSRGAIGALVIGSLVWLTFLRPRLALVAVVGVALAAVTVAPAALKDRLETKGTSGDVALRSDIWQSAMDIYSEHPIVGVGLNNFSSAYSNLPSTLASSSQRRLLHQAELLTPPHAQNLYLNILAEEGLLGIATFALLTLLSVGVVYRGCHVRDRAGRAICTGIGAGLITLAIHSLLDVTLFGPMALPVFALVGVAAVFVSIDSEQLERRRGGLGGRAAG